LKLLQEKIVNLEKEIHKIANPDQLEMLKSPSHRVVRWSDETVKQQCRFDVQLEYSYGSQF